MEKNIKYDNARYFHLIQLDEFTVSTTPSRGLMAYFWLLQFILAFRATHIPSNDLNSMYVVGMILVTKLTFRHLIHVSSLCKLATSTMCKLI